VLKNQYDVNIAPSTYYEFKSRKTCHRKINDDYFKPLILEIYNNNYQVYGVDKIWHSLTDGGYTIGRTTVYRLMGELNISGAIRGKVKKTTIQDKKDECPDDLVNRNFNADEPNKLWVADFTYVYTYGNGWVFVAFIIDVYSRRIIGHFVSKQMITKMVANAFKIAIYTRLKEGYTNFEDLIHHNDKGSQYTAIDFQLLLKSAGVKSSIGTVGDSYDNALAETINGAYKTELIKKRKPWSTYNDVRDQTAAWVNWYNTKRICKHCNWQSPVDFEQKNSKSVKLENKKI
jgi:putative transposase